MTTAPPSGLAGSVAGLVDRVGDAVDDVIGEAGPLDPRGVAVRAAELLDDGVRAVPDTPELSPSSDRRSPATVTLLAGVAIVIGLVVALALWRRRGSASDGRSHATGAARHSQTTNEHDRRGIPMSDRIDELKGKAKEGLGKVTDDEQMEQEGRAEATAAKMEREAEGAVDQAAGKAQETVGDATGDEETELEGKARQVEGDIKRAG